MIQHYKSHRLTNLAKKLFALLEDTTPDDPFQAYKIIVPNLDTSRWLKMYLAEKNGIAANIEFLLPSEWQWNRVRTLYPDLPKTLPSDMEPMKWMLFDLLSETEVRRKFPFLDGYIQSQGEDFEQQAALQLAGQLSYLFDQYQVYRPEMILNWQQGKTGNGDEKWQSELWKLFDDKVKQIYQGVSGYNRAELFLKTLKAPVEDIIQKENSLFVFNPGLHPKTIADLLNKTGIYSDVFLFQIQPSHKLSDTTNELLHSFGNEVRRVTELIDFPESEIHTDFSSSIPDSDLGKIQQSIITNGSLPDDGSARESLNGVEVRSCHSPVREIETLQQYLLELFEKYDDLHPDDILVVTPNLDDYRAAVHAVFGVSEDGLPDIPYHCDNGRSGQVYDLEQAIQNLTDLTSSRFTYSEVMDFFGLKSVYEKYECSDSDVSVIRGWMEENNVIWGLDSDHRKEWDQPAETLQTWHAAMKRGWLGQWMDSDNRALIHDALLFNDINDTSKQAIWAAFSKYLNMLSKFRTESKKRRSCTGWCAFMRSWMGRFFIEEALSSREGISVFNNLDALEEFGRLAKFSREIGFSEFKSEFISKLDNRSAGSANFNRGVVFSSMVPVRSIPFKVIALIGLNEETFPRKPRAPEFDLMTRNPALNDRNRKEEDRNLFLESILAAESEHYCSYIGQSPVDNEMIAPSPVVGEWVDFLASYSGLKPEQIIQKEPLTGFSVSGIMKGKTFSDIYFKTAKSIAGQTERISGLKLSKPLPEGELDEIILAEEFVQFFGNPVQWFLKKRFRASLYDPDSEKKEFEMDSLEKHILFQRVFGWTLSGMAESEMENLLVQSGALPTGWSGRSELKKTLGYVQSSFNKLKQLGYDPELIRTDVSVRLSSVRLEGPVISYAHDNFVDISASGMSGKLAVQTWLRHLLVSAGGKAESESLLLCELKKGSPKLFRFEHVEQPNALLEKWMDQYNSGKSAPLNFFPKTLYEYVKAEKSGKKDSFQKAAKEFEGDEFSYPESDNQYIHYLMGEDVKFRDEFIAQPFRNLIDELMGSMEEVK